MSKIAFINVNGRLFHPEDFYEVEEWNRFATSMLRPEGRTGVSEYNLRRSRNLKIHPGRLMINWGAIALIEIQYEPA